MVDQETIREYLEKVQEMPFQSQRALLDQFQILRAVAVKLKLYDAADNLRDQIDSIETHSGRH